MRNISIGWPTKTKFEHLRRGRDRSLLSVPSIDDDRNRLWGRMQGVLVLPEARGLGMTPYLPSQTRL